MASTSRRRRQLAREHAERQAQRRAVVHERAVKRRRTIATVTAAVVAALLVVGLVAWVRSTGSGRAATAGATGTPPPSASALPATCTWRPAPPQGGQRVARPPTKPETRGTSTATITLEGLGTVELQLDAARAPCAVTSFRHLASTGYFDSTACHRLSTSQSLRVLQCGDPSGTGQGGPGYSFADESIAGAKYPAGTVAMANSGPDTNGSQFFIVYGDSQLQPNYTVLGTVTKGLDVVAKVAAKGVQGGGTDGKPVQPVVIQRVSVDPPVAGSPTPAAASP